LDARAEISNSKSAQRCSDDIKPAQRPQRFASVVANTMMVRTVPETQSILLKIARERWREGRTSHVIEHEVVLCEDGTTAMVYFYFGLPGDDAVMARRRGDRSAGLACPGQLTKKIKDLFGRQGLRLDLVPFQRVLIRDLLVREQRWLRGRIQ